MFIERHSSKAARWLGPLAAAAMIASVAQAQTAAPFAGFSGEWSGGGDIAMTDGSREKIRCKASYSVTPSGEGLHVSINCASDSYKVQVVSNIVVDAGGQLSGSWQEKTRQAEGSVTGRIAGPGQIQASLEGTVYGIQMSVNTRGNQQAVAIRAQGTDVQKVDIVMRRG